MDRHNVSDHVCRITRQRAGVSASTLPLPASPSRYSFFTHVAKPTPPAKRQPTPRATPNSSMTSEAAQSAHPPREGTPPAALPPPPSPPPLGQYLVPLVRTDKLLASELGSRHIDVLKVDVESEWNLMRDEMAPLFARRAFTVLIFEVDSVWHRPAWRSIEAISCFAHQHGYTTLLKVPCAGRGVAAASEARQRGWDSPNSHRAAYMTVSGKYHALMSEQWGLNGSAPCSQGGQHCNVQDILVVDSHLPSLPALVELGNLECGTSFPSDVGSAAESPVAAAGTMARGAAAAGIVPADAIGTAKQSPAYLRLEGGANDTVVPAARARHARHHPPAAGALVGESEGLRPQLWPVSRAERRRLLPRAAQMLPDGTWSCRLRSESGVGTANGSGTPLCVL